MRIADDPWSIVVRLSADATKAPEVELGSQVTVGQLAAVAWELAEVAREARQGQLAAQAAQARQVALVAQGIRNGGKG